MINMNGCNLHRRIRNILLPAAVLLLCFAGMARLPVEQLVNGNETQDPDFPKIEFWEVAASESGDTHHWNLALTSIDSKEIDGLTVELNHDGSFMLDGTYNGKKKYYLRLSPKNYTLPKGGYTFSDEGFAKKHKRCNLLVGQRYETENGNRVDNILKNDPEATRLIIEEEASAGVWYGFILSPGFTATHETVRFMLYSDTLLAEQGGDASELSFEPAPVCYYRGEKETENYILLRIDKERFSKLKSSERSRIVNNFRYQYDRMYEWATIVFEDGTGLHFCKEGPLSGTYGILDAAGRIAKELPTDESGIPF